jgi:hypothetical protein
MAFGSKHRDPDGEPIRKLLEKACNRKRALAWRSGRRAQKGIVDCHPAIPLSAHMHDPTCSNSTIEASCLQLRERNMNRQAWNTSHRLPSWQHSPKWHLARSTPSIIGSTNLSIIRSTPACDLLLTPFPHTLGGTSEALLFYTCPHNWRYQSSKASSPISHCNPSSYQFCIQGSLHRNILKTATSNPPNQLFLH